MTHYYEGRLNSTGDTVIVRIEYDKNWDCDLYYELDGEVYFPDEVTIIKQIM